MDDGQGPLEAVGIDPTFWRGKKVFITGHTGFKGGWLCLWLARMGARLAGYALPPATPSLFAMADVGTTLEQNHFADIRDAETLAQTMRRFDPDIVFHLAAQSLVRVSYARPLETYAVNVMGAAHALEAARLCPSLRAFVMVTSDKCYENKEWPWGYRENEPMGGYDPYSSSKGCVELLTASWRRSFMSGADRPDGAIALATARAGNVIGGGDWSQDRLVPDIIRAWMVGDAPVIRAPSAIRPWQHALEPLSGYLLLAQRLCRDGTSFAEGWNFGPDPESERTVGDVADRLIAYLEACTGQQPGAGQADAFHRWHRTQAPMPHEAGILKLDSAKARARLGWRPRWTADEALLATALWHAGVQAGQNPANLCVQQITAYEAWCLPDGCHRQTFEKGSRP
jgi:CDP-glucose 4,6-dehydratase